jgi:hypothetical protein
VTRKRLIYLVPTWAINKARSKPSFSLRQLALPITLAVFGWISKAQLFACDAAGCPLNQWNRPQCVIGNLTAGEIGIANFSTSISPEPLTWTLSTSVSTDPTNNSQGIYTRSLFLGAPPLVDLQASKGLQSCALFFDDVSSNLAFPSHDLDTYVGTYSDALGLACVNNLMVQTNSTLNEMMAGNNDTTTLRQTLEIKLYDNPPNTCTNVTSRSFGTISVKV